MGLVKAEVDIMGMFGGKFGEKWIKPLSSKLKKKKKADLFYKLVFSSSGKM